MSTKREPLCKTKGCPTRRKDFEGDVNDWHIPWCGHGLEGHHHHVKKRSQGGTKGDMVFLCPGCHDHIDNGHWGNAVLDIPEVGRVYRVWDQNNRTVFERVIEAAPGGQASSPQETLPAPDEPSARDLLVKASAKGRQALELASSVGEVKDIRDRAEALRQYANAAGLGLQAQNEMADIKIRAERKAGQLLGPDTIKRESGKRGEEETSYQAGMRLAGIATETAHRWQIEAQVPDNEYDAYAQTCMEEGVELTSTGVLRLAYALLRQTPIESPPTPPGQFATIVADPPWSYRDILPQKQGAASNYACLSLEDIIVLPATKAFATDAHLYLWVTTGMIEEGYQVVRAWGFTPKSFLTWHKTGRMGLGRWFRNDTEHIIFAVRGKLKLKRQDARNIFAAPARGHSEKPEEFITLVESCSPGPYLELFSRRVRPNWTTWGDEVGKIGTQLPLTKGKTNG